MSSEGRVRVPPERMEMCVFATRGGTEEPGFVEDIMDHAHLVIVPQVRMALAQCFEGIVVPWEHLDSLAVHVREKILVWKTILRYALRMLQNERVDLIMLLLRWLQHHHATVDEPVRRLGQLPRIVRWMRPECVSAVARRPLSWVGRNLLRIACTRQRSGDHAAL